MGCSTNTHRPPWQAAVPPDGAGQGEQFGACGAGAPPVESPKSGFASGGVFGVSGFFCNGTTASTGSACETGQQPHGLR